MTDKLPLPNKSILTRHAGSTLLERFVGSESVCASWRGYARMLLGQVRHILAQGGIEVGARHVVAPDGTRISVWWNGSQNIIKIDAPSRILTEQVTYLIYLESGLVSDVEYTEYYRLNPLAISSTYLFRTFNDTEPDKRKECPVYFHPDMPDSGEMSLSKLSNPTIDLPETEVTEEEKINISNNAITYRRMNANCPASMFTGAMKRWIQAKYGLKYNNNQTMFTEQQVWDDYYILQMNGLYLDWGFGNTPGLFWDDTRKRYWLVYIDTVTNQDRVTFKMYKLDFDPIARILLDLLKIKNPNPPFTQHEVDKLRAYALSRASINVNKMWYVSVTPGVIGSPYGYYGWKFNHTGSQASIVLLENIQWRHPDWHMYSRLYQVNISVNAEYNSADPDSVPLNFELKLTEEHTTPEAFRLRPYSDFLFYHEYYYSYYSLVAKTPSTVTYNETGHGETGPPVYCYYEQNKVSNDGTFDYNDSLVLLRYTCTNTDLGARPASPGANPWYYEAAPGKEWDFSVTQVWGIEENAGFTRERRNVDFVLIGDVDDSFVGKNNANGRTFIDYNVVIGLQEWADLPGVPGALYRAAIIQFDFGESATDAELPYLSAIIQPRDDASSAYLLSYKQNSHPVNLARRILNDWAPGKSTECSVAGGTFTYDGTVWVPWYRTEYGVLPTPESAYEGAHHHTNVALSLPDYTLHYIINEDDYTLYSRYWQYWNYTAVPPYDKPEVLDVRSSSLDAATFDGNLDLDPDETGYDGWSTGRYQRVGDYPLRSNFSYIGWA